GIRGVFQKIGGGRLFSRTLVAALNDLGDRPWAELRLGLNMSEGWPNSCNPSGSGPGTSESWEGWAEVILNLISGKPFNGMCRGRGAEIRGQRTEVRRRGGGTEDRGRRSEVRRPRTEGRGRRTEGRGPRTGGR